MRYQSTTGLDDDQIQELVSRVDQIERAHPRPGGRPVVLDLPMQVVVVLLLARQNLTQSVVADLTGVSQPTISRIWRRLLPILGEMVALHGIPLAEAAKDRVLLVDGTDMPTGNRAATGRSNYSGKRHRQGLAVQVACDLDGTLIAISDPVPGARHDAAAIDLVGWQTTLTNHDWIADRAYLAAGAITPIRKPPGRELHKSEKRFNHDVSALRAAVERCIAHVKNWKILRTGYRGRLAELPAIIRIITKIELYRLGW